MARRGRGGGSRADRGDEKCYQDREAKIEQQHLADATGAKRPNAWCARTAEREAAEQHMPSMSAPSARGPSGWIRAERRFHAPWHRTRDLELRDEDLSSVPTKTLRSSNFTQGVTPVLR